MERGLTAKYVKGGSAKGETKKTGSSALPAAVGEMQTDGWLPVVCRGSDEAITYIVQAKKPVDVKKENRATGTGAGIGTGRTNADHGDRYNVLGKGGLIAHCNISGAKTKRIAISQADTVGIGCIAPFRANEA